MLNSKYLIKRILQALIVIVGILLVTFIVLYVIPGSPVYEILGKYADADSVEKLTEKLGLSRPVLESFFEYSKNMLSGNLGTSFISGKSVASTIGEALPNTVKLAALSAFFAWGCGGICAIIASSKRGGHIDRIFSGLSVFGISVPVFMMALFLQYVFAYRLNVVNILSDKKGLVDFVLPAIALGWSNAGEFFLIARSAIDGTLDEDYVLMSRARGAQQRKVILYHSLRNAAFPIISLMGMQIASMLSGAVITETVFSLNGLGRLAVDAIYARDIPVVQGVVFVVAVIVVSCNLIADVLCAATDKKTGWGIRA